MTDILRGVAPHDLIAYAWFVMGFRPRESLVLIGLTGSPLSLGTVARLDLPRERDAARAGVSFADMLERTGEDVCVLLTVTDSGGDGPLLPPDGDMPFDDLSAEVAATLGSCGVRLLDALVVGPERYRSYLCRDETCCPPAGSPLADVTTSRVAAAMVLEGRCVVDDVEDLVADVDPAAAAARGEPVLAPPAGRPGRARRRAVYERWCDDVDADAAEPAGPAELLAAMRSPDLRDAVIATLVTGGRDAGLRLVERGGRREDWPDEPDEPDEALVGRGRRLLAVLARRAPAGHRAAPLACLAWLAWWSGDGVRGRLLVELALEDDAGYSLAVLVGTLLEHSVVPPWQEEVLERRAGRGVRLGAPGG